MGEEEPRTVELGANERCPCGSGKRYGRCCAKKSLSFGRDADGEIVKTMPIHETVLAEIARTQEEFVARYGREMGQDDLVFGSAAPVGKGLVDLVRTMRHAGIAPDLAYAVYRTGGLLPVEGELDVVSDADLREFSAFREEFEDLLSDSGIESGEMNSLAFVMHGNALITEDVVETSNAVQAVLRDFIARHSSGTDFPNTEIRVPLDYGLFSALKTLKTVESLDRLSEHGHAESIYALSRGLVENYLHLCAVAADPGFFESKVLPKSDRARYSFAEKNGRINYNKVIHNDSGETVSVWINPRSLLRYANGPEDESLFELFYQVTSQYIHVDVLSAAAYFHDADPFDEIDPALVASLIGLVVACMVLGALGRVPGVSATMTSDVEHFLTTLHAPFRRCLLFAQADPLHSNEVYALLLDVIDRWSPAA